MQGSRDPSQDCDSDAHDRKRLRQVSPSSIPSPTHENTKQLCVPFTHYGDREGQTRRRRDTDNHRLRCEAALTVQPDFIITHETHSAVVENRTVGFYALGCKGDRLNLQHLWVLPDAMGQGVGRWLFAHAVERVRDLGFGVLEIESDPNADGFYQRMGARRIGTRVTVLEGRRRELPVLVYEVDQAA